MNDYQKYDSKERQRFKGLFSRLGSVEFLNDLCLMYDVLFEISELSLELQKQSVTIPEAHRHIKRTIRVLTSFKAIPGEKSEEADQASGKMEFQGCSLHNNSKIIVINRNQFIQSLVDRMSSRLCSAASDNIEILNSLEVLDSSKWPQNPSIRHGEKEIKNLTDRFRFDERQAIQGLREWIESENKSVPGKLTELLTCVKTIPCSSAE